MIEQMLAYNREFVANKGYEAYTAPAHPQKKTAILTCMDTRLVELLLAALNIKNGDVVLIKSIGGMITGPFDSTVRSLLLAVVELGVEEIMVIGHTDCGLARVDTAQVLHELVERGASPDDLRMMRYCGLDPEQWLRGFSCLNASVAESVQILKTHLLMPKDVKIRGFVIDTHTGELTPQE